MNDFNKIPDADLDPLDSKDTIETIDTLTALLKIVKTLRGPKGCPWDKEQTHKSLAPFALEETYELIEAIEALEAMPSIETMESTKAIDSVPVESVEAIKKELGDVLFQVVLHSTIAEEKGHFKFSDVASSLKEKLIRRHPHVFATSPKSNSNITAKEVEHQWQEIKNKETSNRQKLFDIPLALPSLQRSYKIGKKSKQYQFDWENPQDVFVKVMEELKEVQAELPSSESFSSHQRLQEEFGDLLFSLAQWARHLDLEPEQCLRMANKKFESRFEKMLNLCEQKNLDWSKLSDSEKESLWRQIKA